MKINIRIASETDLPAMLEIYNDIILHTAAVYDYEPHTLEMRTEWFRTKQKQGFPVFVAEHDGAIVGFSTIGPFRREWLDDRTRRGRRGTHHPRARQTPDSRKQKRPRPRFSGICLRV